MDRFIVRLLFAGTAIAGLSQPLALAEDVETADASEPTVSVDQPNEVEEKKDETSVDQSPAKTPEVIGPSPTVEIPAVIKQRALFQHATYPDAWRAAQESNRPILVYVCMPNCHYCVKMKEQVYKLPRVKDLVSNSFETIKADRFAHPKLISSLKIRLYPTTVLVSPNNKILDVIEGYSDATKFQQRLQTGLASLSPPPSIKKVAAR